MKRLLQAALACPCGRTRILARGLCASCYTMKRQDDAYFGGLREDVLKRDNHRCRACDRPARGRRTILVHHRRPGVSELRWMLALCPGCHAKVHRLRVARRLPPLLLQLWREQHPRGHEQPSLNFTPLLRMADPLPLPL